MLHSNIKVAVLGTGGREHAIAWKLAQNIPPQDIYVLSGNAGIPNSMPLNIYDFDTLQKFCETKDIKFIFVGPEAPLAGGIVNHFEGSDILVLGPDKEAAQLESSKIYAKEFMRKYNVATANFRKFDKQNTADETIEKLNGNLVIKYDGLAAGKGVYVCDNIEEANKALNEIKSKYSEEAEFLIEEKLIGEEISIIGFTDGKSIKMLLPSQDHKQLLDGDQGPNTGGMGAFCPVDIYDEALAERVFNDIIQPTLNGLQAEKLNYKGVLYFGIMITEDGPKLLEYNVRLGDPETEVILPALKSDLLALALSCFNGNLADFEMEFHPEYFVDVVMSSAGYPKEYVNGYEISGLQNLNEDTLLFHAATKLVNGQYITAGGRVLNVVAKKKTLEEAINTVYSEISKIDFKGAHYRKDIGQRKSVKID